MEQHKYLIGTHIGGLMEMPEFRFDAPFDIIESDSVKNAIQEYNKKHNCFYFYGAIMCEITDNGRCIGIDIDTSRTKCEEIIAELKKEK